MNTTYRPDREPPPSRRGPTDGPMSGESTSVPVGRSSGAWVMVSVGAAGVAQLGFVIFLSRSLDQVTFGRAAVLLALLSLPRMLVDGILAAPIIQRSQMPPRMVRASATLALLVSAGLGLILWLGAPLIEVAFGIDGVAGPVRWLAPAMLAFGLAVVPQAMLNRVLDFRSVAMIDVVALLVGHLGVGILAGYLGAGISAVVAAFAAEGVLRMVLSQARHPVVPTMRAGAGELAELARFSGSTGVGSLLNLLATRGDYLVVSRLAGPVALAAYTQAYQLAYNPGLVLSRAVNRWLFPLLARSRAAEAVSPGEILIQNLRRFGLLTGGVAVSLAVLAPELVTVLFGARWEAAVLPLQIMAVGVPARVLHSVHDAQVKAAGQVNQRAVVQGVYAAAVIGLVLIGTRSSLAAAAVGLVIAISVNYILMAALASSTLGLDRRRLWSAHGPILAGAAGVAIALVPATLALRSAGTPTFAVLLLGGIASAVSLAAVLFLVFGEKRSPAGLAASDSAEATPSTATPVAATPLAATPLAATPVTATPVTAGSFPPAPIEVESATAPLLSAFDADGVPAVFFKGHHRLERALDGRGDLDLLIPPDRGAAAAAVLERHGFVAAPNGSRSTAGYLTDWFGPGSDGRLLHVQLHHRLVAGGPRGPIVAVPRYETLLATSSRVVPRVASPEYGAAIRLCDLALGSRRTRRSRSADTLAFCRAVPVAHTRSALDNLFRDASVIEAGLAFVANGGNGTARALRRALTADGDRVLQRGGLTGSTARAAVAKLNRRTIGLPILPRRRLATAPIVAVIGSDGAGKSTVTRHLTEKLGDKIDTRFLYLGTGDGPSSLLRLPLVWLRKLWERRQGSEDASTAMDQNPPAATGPVTEAASAADDDQQSGGGSDGGGSDGGGGRSVPEIARLAWAVTTVLERRSKLRRARRYSARGFVVICDRYPQAGLVGMFDGPRLRDHERSSRLGRAVARWERRNYEAMAATPPDLVLLLDVGVDVAAARRPEERRQELERRTTAARELRYGAARHVVIDAEQSADTVLGEAMRRVLEACR